MRTHHYRYGAVLLLILVTLAFQLAAPSGDWLRVATVALQAATLMAAVVASNSHPWMVRVAIVGSLLLVAGSTAALLGTDEIGTDSTRIASVLLVALAPAAIISGIVREFREQGEITIHTMFGGLCLYLLLGMLFAFSLEAIQSIFDESMLKPAADSSSDFVYFSFTTQTTTGYGDLVPATNLSRSLAVTQQLIGQIYLVTVVALIVGNLRPAPRRKRGVA